MLLIFGTIPIRPMGRAQTNRKIRRDRSGLFINQSHFCNPKKRLQANELIIIAFIHIP
jgi:hypothetical protein